MSEKETITIEKATIWKFAFFAVLALFVVSLFTGGFGINAGTGNVVNTVTAPTPTGVAGASAVKITPSSDDPLLGDEDAKITVYEFSDFQCPYCSRAFTGAVTELKNSNAFKDGDVNFVYRHLPLNSIHPLAQKAAEASVCAQNQGKFWEYHDRLFLNQQSLDVASLKGHAVELGLNAADFNDCLDSGDGASKVAKDLKSATEAGGRGTPYFVVYNKDNGKTAVVSGAVPYVQIETAIASIK